VGSKKKKIKEKTPHKPSEKITGKAVAKQITPRSHCKWF